MDSDTRSCSTGVFKMTRLYKSIAENTNATVEELLLAVEKYPREVLQNPCLPLLALEKPGHVALLRYRATLEIAVDEDMSLYKRLVEDNGLVPLNAYCIYIAGQLMPEDSEFIAAMAKLGEDCIGDGVATDCLVAGEENWPVGTDYGYGRLVISLPVGGT